MQTKKGINLIFVFLIICKKKKSYDEIGLLGLIKIPAVIHLYNAWIAWIAYLNPFSWLKSNFKILLKLLIDLWTCVLWYIKKC